MAYGKIIVFIFVGKCSKCYATLCQGYWSCIVYAYGACFPSSPIHFKGACPWVVTIHLLLDLVLNACSATAAEVPNVGQFKEAKDSNAIRLQKTGPKVKQNIQEKLKCRPPSPKQNMNTVIPPYGKMYGKITPSEQCVELMKHSVHKVEQNTVKTNK